MAAGPRTPLTADQKLDLSTDWHLVAQAQLSMLKQADAVLLEDSSVLTTYLASGWVKRRALAQLVIDTAGTVPDTAQGRPVAVVANIWNTTLANWAVDKDPDVTADLLNQISARWDTAAGVQNKVDKA